MADKAKHAHGSRKNLEAAIASKAVDAFDVLFLSGEDEAPAIGWLDKNGNPIIIAPTDDLGALESQLEEKIAMKASVEDLAGLETEMATKVDADTVQTMIEEHASSAIEIVEF